MAGVDQTGKLLFNRTIYPHPPQKQTDSKRILKDLIEEYSIDLIAIGNGTASRETEELIAALIKEYRLKVRCASYSYHC